MKNNKLGARTPRPGKLDALAVAIARDFGHVHTATIESKQRILQFESDENDNLIVTLQAALENARDRRSKIGAMLKGLASVLERR